MGATPNLNLFKPDIGSTGWGTNVNGNWDTLDGAVVRDGSGDVLIVQDAVGEICRSGLGAEGQVSLSANLDQDDWLLKRDVDGGSSYAEAGAVLALQRDVTNVTSEDGNFLECQDGAGAILARISKEGLLTSTGMDVAGPSYSVRLGYQAGLNATGQHVLIGYQAGYALTNGTENVFIGPEAGKSMTTEDYCTFVGSEAGESITGGANTVVGARAGRDATSVESCVFFGVDAGLSGAGNSNTCIGHSAGKSFTTGNDNTLIGHSAGRDMTSGAYNTYVGGNAGLNTEDGGANVYVGHDAGQATVAGSDNVFLGSGSGYGVTSGSYNVFTGYRAGYGATTDQRNVCSGNQAGYGGPGTENVLIGADAGYSLDDTNGNVMLGYQAGYSNESGDSNVFVGYQAGYNETGSNKLYVANSNTSSPLLYGEFDNDLLRVNGYLEVVNADAADVAALVKGAASQSADLQQWVDSGDTVLARVDAAGYLGAAKLRDAAMVGAALEIGGITRTTDAAPGTVAVVGNSAKSDASSNQDGGDVLLYAGDHASGGGNAGSVVITNADGSTKVAEFTDDALGFFAVSPAGQQSHIADPSGGTTVDSEVRSAINSILALLESFGLTASS